MIGVQRWERTGSGGPRGLQILLSGGSPVRGGFDSHTFPPATPGPQGRWLRVAVLGVGVLALLTVAGQSTVCEAQEVGGADTVLVGGSATVTSEDGIREAPGNNEGKGFLKSPTGIAFRSLFLPGWGQATNKDWGKMAIAIGIEGYLIYTIIRDTRELSDLDPNTIEYQDLYESRTGNIWFLGGAVLLSMADAYVSAHLKGIETRIEPEPEDHGASLHLGVRF